MTTASREQAVAILQRHAAALRALGVKRLGLFGSFVRQGRLTIRNNVC